MRAKGISERRACRLVGLWRSVQRAVSRQAEDDHLKMRMCELAAERRRFGYRRIHWMLGREGFVVNHKKVYRLYREQGLSVRKRRRRHKVSTPRIPLMTPSGPNHTWSMDFVFDATASGQVIKCLTVVDDCTKECVDIAVASKLNGHAVVEALDRACRFRGYPTVIRTDQGPEFTGRVLDQWAHDHGVALQLTQPGKPTQNAYIESFNGKFRDECLNENWFMTVAHAKAVIAIWRTDYNECRPHGSLAKQTPTEFATRLRQTGDISPLSLASARLSNSDIAKT